MENISDYNCVMNKILLKMNSFNVEELKNLKINLKHNITEGESISNIIDYNINNPEEVSIHSSKGERLLPLFSHADVKVNLYKDNEKSPASPKKVETPPRRHSLQSIRAILQISDDEMKTNHRRTSQSYQKPVTVIRKLDEIVKKMKNFTENARRNLKLKTHKKDSNACDQFKKYLDESHDLFEELQKHNSNKRSRRDSSSYRSRRRRSSDRSISSDSPPPKRYRSNNNTSKTYGHSSKHYDSEASGHNKSSQSKKNSSNKNRSHRDVSVNSCDSISSIDSGSGEEIFEQSTRSKNDRSYDRHSRSTKHSRRVPRYSERRHTRRSYFEEAMTAKDIEERYYRYYAVMYAFTIIMDILRQDGINSF